MSADPTLTDRASPSAPSAPSTVVIDGDGLSWVESHATEIRDVLARDGALWLRGFGLRAAGDLSAVSRVLGIEPMVEREGFTRRDRLADGVYSGSVWPPDQPICHHHELSYVRHVPRTLVLGCLTAASAGGWTGLVDAEEMLAALPTDLVIRFEREGWLLTRSYRAGAGLPWQEAFGSADRSVVESYCAATGIHVSWQPDGGLRTTQRRPAVIAHPLTGRRCWVNQVAFLNEWTMEPAVREYLVDEFGPDGLPFKTFFGDGAPIDKGTVALINAQYERLSRPVRWGSGDVLLLDNLRTAHSREPFDGRREMALVLADPIRLAEPNPLPSNGSDGIQP
jgi:alpha-ketoglutarate-dependent taurine dioxygenase